MEPGLFARGLLIGLAIAAPVGPIGLLCIRRALAGGFAAGFVTGLGAAAADAVYGAVAAFGLGAVSGFLVAQADWIRLGGGLALVWLGWATMRQRPADPAVAATAGQARRAGTLLAAFASTFALTLANPSTILSFVAVFAGLGLGDPAMAGAAGSAPAAASVVVGVFLGSAGWWLFLAGGTASLRRQVPPGLMRWINRLSGAALAGFGLAAVASLAF